MPAAIRRAGRATCGCWLRWHWSGGRFGRLFRRSSLRQAQAGPTDQPQQDLGSLSGGLLAGVAVALGLGWLAGIDAGHLPGLLITSVVAVFASVLGDLFESLIKRHAGARTPET